PCAIHSTSAELWIVLQFISSPSFLFPGLIDEVALYDRALTADEIALHFLAATRLAGDFNDDGQVDAADYTVWRNSFGEELDPLTRADADGDGVVTALDYLVWKAHYGRHTGEGALLAHQVPEPGALAVAVAMVSLAALSRRRRSACQ